MNVFLWNILVFMLIVRPLSCTINPGDSVKCTPVDGKPQWCACKSSTSNKIVDLSSLEMAGLRKPSYTAMGTQEQTKGWTAIAWSPCKDFDVFANKTLSKGDKACINTGFAAYYVNGSEKRCQSFGSHENTSQELRPSGVDINSRIILYQIFTHKSKNVSHDIRASVRLVCGKNTTLTYFVSNDHYGTYIAATFTANCCCEGVCASTQKDPAPENKKNWWIIGGTISGVVVLVVIIVIAIKKRPRPRLNFPVPVVFNPEDQEEERRQEQRPLIA